MTNILGKKIEHEYVEIGLYTLYLLLGVFIIPLYILYAKGGLFEANFYEKAQAYISFFIVGWIIITGKKLLQIKSLRNSAFYEKYGWLSGGVVHDPENGLLQNIKVGNFRPFGWARSTTKMLIISLFFFFGITMYFGVFQNEFFTGVPQFEFQISKFDQVIFGGFPGSPAETVFAIGILYLFLVDPIKWIIHRLRWNKGVFWIFSIIIAFIFASGWLAFHNSKYSGQEEAQSIVFIFGFFNALFTMGFNSVIPFHAWHDFNNFFKTSTGLYASDEIKSVVLFIYFFMILIGISYFILRRKKKSIDEQYDFSSSLK